MKTTTLSLKFSSFLLTFFLYYTTHSQSIASYTITVESVWDSEANDPINGNSTTSLPGSAHWSNLVGATHNSNVVLLEMGSFATTGVKDVAELGSNTALMSEVQTMINDGNADQFLQTPFMDFAPRTSAVLMDIEVSEEFPMLSLLSMIAPSPDWMIAVNSINLREGNAWRNEIIIDLFPYDAGTDSGTDYTSPDQVTNPVQPITSLVNVNPFNDRPIGTLTISFNETLSTVASSLENGDVTIFPNPSNGIVNINTSNQNPLKNATVYDVLGKQVSRYTNSTSETFIKWSLDALNPGMYLIKLTLDDGSTSSKRIILN